MISHVDENGRSKLVPTGKKSTVGYELDKMASNIAIFRNGAGVHYRSDALGIELGELIAIYFKRYPKYVEVSVNFKLRNGKKEYISNISQ